MIIEKRDKDEETNNIFRDRSPQWFCISMLLQQNWKSNFR